MVDDTGIPPAAQAAAPDLHTLTQALQRAMTAWEHAAAAISEAQRQQQLTLTVIAARLERLEREMAAVRHAAEQRGVIRTLTTKDFS